MKLSSFLREAVATARASKVPTILVVLVAAATCCAAIFTVGRQAAAEMALEQTLASPASRVLTITEKGTASPLRSDSISLLSSATHTSQIIALGSFTDVTNGPLGRSSTRVALAPLMGKVDSALTLTAGRLPRENEAIVPNDLLEDLRMDAPGGYLVGEEGEEWAVVGSFEAREPFAHLNSMVLTVPRDAEIPQRVHQLSIVADSVHSVNAVQETTLAILAVADPSSITVQSAVSQAAASRESLRQLSHFGRSFLLLVLGVGAFFVSIVVLSDVLIRRRDLGRRRTLGITRSGLVGLVVLRTLIPASLGALTGSLISWLAVEKMTGTMPWDFVCAVAILTSLIAAIACVPPAIYASRCDPVEVMRTP